MWGAVGCRPLAQIRKFLFSPCLASDGCRILVREFVFVAAHVTEWVSVGGGGVMSKPVELLDLKHLSCAIVFQIGLYR